MKNNFILIITFILSMSALKGQDSQEKTTVQFEWSQTNEFLNTFNQQKEIILKSHNSKDKASTNAVLIIKDNTIVFEEYYNGFSSEQSQRLWSISKSISGALIGIALKKKLLSLSTSVTKFYPELEGEIEKSITLEHLLVMSSGLKWNEGYEKSPFNSHVINMLYLENQKDMATYVAKQNSTYRPGRFFKYSSGDTNLAMGVLKKSMQTQELYNDFPWQELFIPLGITDATWEQDEAGTFIGSSYLYLSARSLARFAKLILDQGQWQGTSIIEEAYVKNSLTPSTPSCITKAENNEREYTYGFYWWLNSSCRELPNKKAFKDLPSSMALALGHHGQTLALFPEQNAIAIRLGADKKGPFNREAWLNEVYKTLIKLPSLKNNNETKAAQ